jgi:hypothetical protein
MRTVGNKSKARLAREAAKLARLRLTYPDLPDIYNLPGFTPNGMGPESWRGGIWRRVRTVLNRAFGLIDVECYGDHHDYRYHIGGTERDRLMADYMIREDMRSACPLVWWSPLSWLRWLLMRKVSRSFFLAVRFGGAEHFNYK